MCGADDSVERTNRNRGEHSMQSSKVMLQHASAFPEADMIVIEQIAKLQNVRARIDHCPGSFGGSTASGSLIFSREHQAS